MAESPIALPPERGGHATMASANEFHTYAHECLKWAYEAKTEDRREQFLSLARVWTHAALRRVGVMIPIDRRSNQEKTPPVGGAGGV